MELVSVIIPTYNSEAVLSPALDSVLSQTHPGIEIIVVDDGSTDNTVAVARDKLTNASLCAWTLIELEENRGPSAARNEGLRIARGAWVQFLDSDDLLAPEKLAHQMSASATSGEDVAVLHSPWVIGRARDDRTGFEGHLCDPDIENRDPVMCLVPRVRPLLAAALIRRSALEEVGGFDESLRFWECEEICFRLAGVGRFVGVPSAHPLYFWEMPADKEYIGHATAKYKTVEVGLAWIEQVLKATNSRRLDVLGLSNHERRLVLDECAHWARQLHHADRDAFAQYMTKLRTLEPGFHPRSPWPLALASRLLSYERAEALAEALRGPRRLLARAAYGFAFGEET